MIVEEWYRFLLSMLGSKKLVKNEREKCNQKKWVDG